MIKIDDPRTFVVCVDGSEISERCVDAAMKLMREGDSIQVVHILEKRTINPAVENTTMSAFSKLMRGYSDKMRNAMVRLDSSKAANKHGIANCDKTCYIFISLVARIN